MPAGEPSISSEAALPMTRAKPPRWLVTTILVTVWFAGMGLGFATLERHATTPGTQATAPARWPAESALPLASAGRATLLLFAHPHCPCTRATMGELEVLLARRTGKVDACVVFVRPPGSPEGWERTDLWERAAGIPGVAVRADVDGVEAARFGARTSGQVLVYDAEGELRFAGGITGSRGHSGDNAGRTAAEAAVVGPREAPTSSLVFGCSLLAPSCGTKDGTCPR